MKKKKNIIITAIYFNGYVHFTTFVAMTSTSWHLLIQSQQ